MSEARLRPLRAYQGTGARPLPPAEAGRLLDDVVARAGSAAPTGLLAFDLDSTLLDNRPRQALIMREYGVLHGVAALAACDAEHWCGWDARLAMAGAGLAPDGIERHHDPFREFWKARFFTSEYCAIDRAVPGAAGYLRRVAATGARICYVTGRHEAMRAGTLASFATCGLPVPDGERVLLMLKPTAAEDDDAYKARTHAALAALGPLVAAFDNEPMHINAYQTSFPEALAIHLATDFSMRSVTVAPGIPSIHDFLGAASDD